MQTNSNKQPVHGINSPKSQGNLSHKITAMQTTLLPSHFKAFPPSTVSRSNTKKTLFLPDPAIPVTTKLQLLKVIIK
jgi:hypothetical protein